MKHVNSTTDFCAMTSIPQVQQDFRHIKKQSSVTISSTAGARNSSQAVLGWMGMAAQASLWQTSMQQTCLGLLELMPLPATEAANSNTPVSTQAMPVWGKCVAPPVPRHKVLLQLVETHSRWRVPSDLKLKSETQQ